MLEQHRSRGMLPKTRGRFVSVPGLRMVSQYQRPFSMSISALRKPTRRSYSLAIAIGNRTIPQRDSSPARECRLRQWRPDYQQLRSTLLLPKSILFSTTGSLPSTEAATSILAVSVGHMDHPHIWHPVRGKGRWPGMVASHYDPSQIVLQSETLSHTRTPGEQCRISQTMG